MSFHGFGRERISLLTQRARLQQEEQILEAVLTATASEGEGEYETDSENSISESVQVDLEVHCTHRFSFGILNSLCKTPKQEIKYFTHYTGFKSYKRFRLVLEFILPNLDRSQIIIWDSKQGK